MAGKSPNYPSIGLAEAIEKIGHIYRKSGRSSITPEEAVKSWGHKGLHGPALAELSALKKYGLIDSIDKNELRLTDSGINLVLGEKDSKEYKEALQNAALEPSLFREIFERDKSGAMSDGVLKLYLVKNKEFTETGTDKFIKSYRETISLANLNGLDDNKQESSEPGGQGIPAMKDQIVTPDPMALGFSLPTPAVMNVSEELNYRISEECKVRTIFDGKITREAIQKFIDYLNLSKDVYPSAKSSKEMDGKEEHRPIRALRELE